MYKKRGVCLNLNQQERPRLKTPEGATYEVNYITALTWDRLDGTKTIETVANEIKEIGKVENTDLDTIVKNIINELVKVDLVSPLTQN